MIVIRPSGHPEPWIDMLRVHSGTAKIAMLMPTPVRC